MLVRMATAFEVLADPRRRQLLDLLRAGERPVGELVDQLGLSQPGVSKHLRVLREAGLVTVRHEAQRRWYGLCPEPLAEIDAWLAPYRAFWSDRLDALARHLETIDGRPALRFERYLDHPVERVWRAVSEPAEVRRWMSAAADWTLALGAVFELGGQQGQITELHPPHVIGWTFGADRFRFTLAAKGDGCALVFTHIFSDAAPAAQTAA